MKEEWEDKLDLIKECIRDRALSDLTKWLIVSNIVNPAPITPEILEWAKKAYESSSR